VVSDRGTPRKGARVTVKGTIREGFNLGSLGDQINLPGVGVGLVLMESSHKRLVEPALIEAFRMGPPAALLGEIADARRSVLSNIKAGLGDDDSALFTPDVRQRIAALSEDAYVNDGVGSAISAYRIAALDGLALVGSETSLNWLTRTERAITNADLKRAAQRTLAALRRPLGR
jgi:hypothetical protein